MLSGKDLKMKRILLDVKAKDVAAYLNVDKSYISKLEKGVQMIPVHIYEHWVEFLEVNN